MDKRFTGTYFISSVSLTSAIVEFGISSIFILFLVYVLHFTHPLASYTYSFYYGFAYFIPIIIGYISDKYLKNSVALTMGFISMILSQFLLSYSSSFYQPLNIQYTNYFFSIQNISFAVGLFFLALGTSFTHLSFTRIIFSITDENSTVNAFSLYYPILNIGVILGVIVISVVVGENNYHLYKWGFLFFGIVLIIGLLVFWLLKNKYLVDTEGNLMKDEWPGNRIQKLRNNLIKRISSKSVSEIKNLNLRQRFVLFKKSLSPVEKDRLTVFFIFLLIIVIYRIVYSQTNISMVFFIDSFVNRDMGLFAVPVQSFFILNPLFIIILSPIIIKFNNRLKEKNKGLGFVERLLISTLIIGFAFVILTVLGFFLDIDFLDKINMAWIVITEILVALSELFFSIAGYSLVADLSPKEFYSLFYGLFLATRSVSMCLSGLLASLFPDNHDPSFIYNIPIDGMMSFFLISVVLIFTAFITLFIFRNKLRRKMHLDEFTN